MNQEFDQQALIEKAGKRIWEMAETDPQLAALKPTEAVIQAMQRPGFSFREVIATVLAGYADRPALATRAYELRRDPQTGDTIRHYLPGFTTITYDELRRRIEGIAWLWRHHPQHRAAPGEMIAFIGFGGSELSSIDFACVYAQTVAVPLQANLPRQTLTDMLRETAPVTIASSIENLSLAVDHALEQPSVRSVIVFDCDVQVAVERQLIEAARARLGARIALITFDEAVAFDESRAFVPLPRAARGDDNISMIMYTSGSTGAPKGAIIHEAISKHFWTWMPAYVPVIQVAYAPINHFLGRNSIHTTLAQGGTVYFSLKSDMSTLFEDIRAVRPTAITFIPRACELIYQHYLGEVARRVADGVSPDRADAETRAQMRHFLGDRLNVSMVGSSPTAPEVRQFIAECFDIPVFEGYGLTEGGAGGITMNNRVLPRMVLEYKLADVPALGYYATDKPYPRGELVIKTALMIQGYLNRPEATAAIYDAEGFLHTGDVMEERGPGHLVWLDRRNNVIKLSQAEFVAIGPLEAAYLGHCKLVRQIYLYGNSYRAFLLAVVVPDKEGAERRLGHRPTDKEMHDLVMADLQEAARAAGLKSFEVPREVLIEREPFSYENGLLSSVRKPLRPNLKQRYGEALEALYHEMERKQQEELLSLRRDGALSTISRVAGAIKANLGLGELDPENTASYSDLGGDSFGAVSLELLFDEMFGVSVPVSNILHPAASAKRLAAFIDAALQNTSALPRYEQVHPDPAKLRASDLRLEALFDVQFLAAAKVAAPPVRDIKTVLLTGANGFLGRFLCLEWLEQLAKVDGKLICLIRGADTASAYARLVDAIGEADPSLAAHFKNLAAGHLEMLAGDLADPRLGLSAQEFARLADEVDHIVHPAALVNHRLSYRNLFEPNVLGTAELLRLALTERQKRFDFVSSAAVPTMNPALARGPEAMDVRIGGAEMPLVDLYASGYGASKWAGEVMLQEANEKFGLPVNVFRGDMILPHSRYHGQINVPDMVTRMLFSLVKTGIAPKSFYELDRNGERQAAHYDGLPVDFIAASMQQIGHRPFEGFHNYNVCNIHHHDGISLDSFADWVASAGYRLKRIDDHAEWLRRFEEKLRNLGEAERQQSSLSILSHLEHPHPADPPPLASADFEAIVKTLPAGPEIPGLNEAYIHKYLNDMALLGLIEAPAHVVSL